MSALLVIAACASSCAPIVRVGAGPGETAEYRIVGKATLLDVARYRGLGYVEVVAANPGVDPWIPGRGARVVLPTLRIPPSGEHEGIVVNLGDMRLYFFEAGKVSRSYPIGIGRAGLTTPVGRTTVIRKQKHPTWRPTARMRHEDPELPAEVPPGPENPMGEYALYLGVRPYAIHGTNKPMGVGRHVSSGCIRLYDDHIADLFERTAIGTDVLVLEEPVKTAWIAGELYVEAHPTDQQVEQLERGEQITPGPAEPVLASVRKAAKADTPRVDWDLVRDLAIHRWGYAVRVTRP